MPKPKASRKTERQARRKKIKRKAKKGAKAAKHKLGKGLMEMGKKLSA